MQDGFINKGDVDFMLPALCEQLNLGRGDQASERLFSYLDADGDGVVSIEEFNTKLQEIQDCTSRLKGINMEDFESTMFRAFQKFDVNCDFVIDETEFMMVAEKLNLPLSETQMRRLFRYYDTTNNGVIDYSEWKTAAGKNLSWQQALNCSLQEQVERRGLAQFRMLLVQLGDIFTGPGDARSKLSAANAALLNATDEIADVVNTFADSWGTGVAVCGVWKELSGVSSWQDVGDVDLAPFLIFSLILGMVAVRKKAEGDINDLKEEEALLYATGFERDGFTVTEFQKLLKYGQARWVRVGTGDVLSGNTGDVAYDESLKIIASGSCQVTHEGIPSATIARSGRVLGASHFMDVSVVQVATALEPTVAVVLDSASLSRQLAHDESLLMRFSRIATKSTVDAFLDSDVQAATAEGTLP